jgi:hypothetical protein
MIREAAALLGVAYQRLVEQWQGDVMPKLRKSLARQGKVWAVCQSRQS